AEELAADGAQDLGARLATRGEREVAAMQAMLRLQCNFVRRRAQPSLALLELGAEIGSVPARPRGLEEHATHVRVAGVGDGALASRVAARMLARTHAAIGHQLLRGLEAREASDLDGHRRRAQLADTAQRL